MDVKCFSAYKSLSLSLHKNVPLTFTDKSMFKQNPPFVVIGTKGRHQAVKTILPLEMIHFLR